MLKHLGDFLVYKKGNESEETIFNPFRSKQGQKVLSYIKQGIKSRGAGYFKALPHMWSCTETLLPAKGWHAAHAEKPLVLFMLASHNAGISAGQY